MYQIRKHAYITSSVFPQNIRGKYVSYVVAIQTTGEFGDKKTKTYACTASDIGRFYRMSKGQWLSQWHEKNVTYSQYRRIFPHSL